MQSGSVQVGDVVVCAIAGQGRQRRVGGSGHSQLCEGAGSAQLAELRRRPGPLGPERHQQGQGEGLEGPHLQRWPD